MDKNILFSPPISNPKRRQRKLEHTPPETVQDYSNQLTGNEDVNFTRKTTTHTLPAYKDALSYLATLKNEEQPSYFGNSQNMIVNSQYLKFPTLDTLSRPGYLLDFMREAGKNERPCSRANCQSYLMGKFRCRELIIPRKGQETMPGWCIICHYHETNRLFNENYDQQITVNHPIQAFMVFVDLPGEYKLSKTILGEEFKDDKMRGIFGPFPLFHINNYKASETSNGLKCWIEDEKNLVSISSR